ncbi:tyrosine-protein phosphatase [Dyadobacter psychrotolerans]|uniref:Tyrosine-protein phosphatase n=1 Tax=Dyadobacter psychrotolerans TaxID=2541721 RepID=A0A4R5DN07_9BACT|nr:tyrosine-protein phosphatase [Dyadobacter psychrotolerans]TDE15692.1 tyrosine-protein phosphatase [Dyadobacter psychrotolerans]
MNTPANAGPKWSKLSYCIYSVFLAANFWSCARLPEKFNRKTLVEDVYVHNNKKNYTLHLSKSEHLTAVEVSTKPAEYEPELKVGKTENTLALKDQPSRPYYKLISEKDTVVVANRHFDFKNTVNFRDLGGLVTRDGKTVRWGKIYRSDNLSKLDAGDYQKFNDLHIATVMDLRTDHEIIGKEDRLPANVTYIHTPTVTDREGQIAQLRKKVLNGAISEEQAKEQTIRFYEDAVTVNLDSMRSIIHRILDSEQPVLYHCSAGKDRTGIVSALILAILKVDRDTIVNEFLMSNYYRQKKTQKLMSKAKFAKVIKPKMDLKAIQVFMTVDESFINAVFNVIDKKYGGIDLFIENQLEYNPKLREAVVARFTY